MTERCLLFVELWTNDPDFAAHARRNGGARAANQNLQTHHIFGGKTRLNKKTNLIRLCSVTHDWMHIRPNEGRIACLWKQRERGVLDWEQINLCAGFNVHGWAACQHVTGVYGWMQRQLLGPALELVGDRSKTGQ